MRNLFITHQSKQCGVKAHGQRFVSAMAEHAPDGEEWIVVEVGSMDNVRDAIRYWKPDNSIINFHPGTMKYLEPERNFNLKTTLIALPHEELTDWGARNFYKHGTQFSAVLWQDPTSAKGYEVFKIYQIPRLIPKFYKTRRPDRRDIPANHVVVKMFGFGYGGKKPEEMVKAIEESFDKATIVGHFPSNELGDVDGSLGEMMIEKLRAAVTKPGIQVFRSVEMYCNSYMSENDLIQWLNNSDINICFHEDGTGLSSTTDMFMAAGVPFAVNDSPFFRHLPAEVKLSPMNTMKDILGRGTAPWRSLATKTWSPASFAQGVTKALQAIQSRLK